VPILVTLWSSVTVITGKKIEQGTLTYGDDASLLLVEGNSSEQAYACVVEDLLFFYTFED
jgi:hypothetical protein